MTPMTTDTARTDKEIIERVREYITAVAADNWPGDYGDGRRTVAECVREIIDGED